VVVWFQNVLKEALAGDTDMHVLMDQMCKYNINKNDQKVSPDFYGICGEKRYLLQTQKALRSNN
jgi:hypothetical protein